MRLLLYTCTQAYLTMLWRGPDKSQAIERPESRAFNTTLGLPDILFVFSRSVNLMKVKIGFHFYKPAEEFGCFVRAEKHHPIG